MRRSYGEDLFEREKDTAGQSTRSYDMRLTNEAGAAHQSVSQGKDLRH